MKNLQIIFLFILLEFTLQQEDIALLAKPLALPENCSYENLEFYDTSQLTCLKCPENSSASLENSKLLINKKEYLILMIHLRNKFKNMIANAKLVTDFCRITAETQFDVNNVIKTKFNLWTDSLVFQETQLRL
jgi:hypothetical protein